MPATDVPMPPFLRNLLDRGELLHSRCGQPFKDHPHGSPNLGCPFPARVWELIPDQPPPDRADPATWLEEATGLLWPGLPAAEALARHDGQVIRCAEALAAAWASGRDQFRE